jgi:hypothetical protein
MALGFSHGWQYTDDMSHSVCLLELNTNSEDTFYLIIKKLAEAGLQTTRSFDFQIAREAHTDCACPHHGTNQCDCQMIVLLVYGKGKRPATLVIHSRDELSQIFIVTPPGIHVENDLASKIRDLIASIQVSPVEGCKYAT